MIRIFLLRMIHLVFGGYMVARKVGIGWGRIFKGRNGKTFIRFSDGRVVEIKNAPRGAIKKNRDFEMLEEAFDYF